jgi:uncharacterized repeat protein (TIGR01451 family)
LVLLAGLPKLAAAPMQILTGHVPVNPSVAQSIGRLPETTRLNLAVGLPLRNRETLNNLLEQLYDPSSPLYHQWLAVSQFTERFGPSAKDYEAVAAFLESRGLRVTEKYSNRMLLNVSGSVADIEKAFHVNLLVYPHPQEARTFYAPDAEPSLDLDVPILHISGLDNYHLARPEIVKLPPAKSPPQPQDAMPQAGSGSGTGGALMGVDFRGAYASGVGLNGAGQYVGLFELDSYYPSDIATYAAMAGLANTPLQNVLLDGVSGAPGYSGISGAVSEVSLDIEMALSMAPGLAGVIVYEGFNPDSILNKMATDNLAKQLSSSWSFGSATDTTMTQIFQQFAAQGQSYFNASGDDGAYVGSPRNPADNPYVTSVGGTTLTTRGPGLSWLSEKTWNWFSTGQGSGASGGGVSTTWAIPAWQQGMVMVANGGSTTRRNIPDVAMVADNVVIIADNGTQEFVGGTSVASPLWAAFLALVNQQAAANSQPSIGFLNSAIYTIGQSTAYATDFHDIKTGNNTNASSPNKFFSVTGYDLCTGWGTPIGKPLINALAPPPNAKVVVGAGAALTLETCTPTNGTINPGELVMVNFSLQNVGASNTASIVATLQSNVDVQPISGPQTYGVLTGGGAAVSRSYLFIPNGTCGGTISPTLQLKEGANTLTNVAFSFSLGTPLLALNQNFDGVTAPSLPADWSQAISGSVSNWVTTTSFRYSSPNAVSVGGSTNPGVSDLISPGISITTTSAQLSFFNSYVTEATNSSVPFDGCILEIQIGSGSFQDILAAGGSFVSGGYTGTINPSTGNPLAGRQAWGGTSGSFLNTIVNLPAAAAGQNIQLKWRMATDIGNSAGATYWYIDNLAIADGTTCCTPAASADLAVSQNVVPDSGMAGQAVSYSITLTNSGPGPALNVNFTDVLPANATFLFAPPGCVHSSGIVTCAIPVFLAGSKTNFTILVLPTADGMITNTLTVASSVSDPNPVNSTATAITIIYAAPAISIQPSNQVASVGSDVSFSVLATGTAPLNYQWYLEGTNLLDGATESTLQLTNLQIGQTGNYGVVITNLFGSITSDPASLKVLVPPAMTLASLDVTATNVLISLLSVPGLNYTLEYKNSLTDASWSPLFPAIPGNGLVITLQDTNGALIPSRFYRVNCNQ